MGNEFDLASLAPATDEVEFEVFNTRAKRGTGIWITVYGRDSDVYKAITRKQQDRRFKTMGRSRGSMQLTAEELEAESFETLIACTKSWRTNDENGVVTYDGQRLNCTPENMRKLYEGVPVIKEQVDDAIHDRSNFLKR